MNVDTISHIEAARLLHVHRNTILNMLEDGRLPVFSFDQRGRRLLSRFVVEALAHGVELRSA